MSEIKIQNMPELEDGYEYSFGKPDGLGGEKWQILNHGKWSANKAYVGFDSAALYRRPLPKPDPEPEREIRLPIEWATVALVECSDKRGSKMLLNAVVGLLHYHNGRVYRLERFEFEEGIFCRWCIWNRTRAKNTVFVLMEDES